MYSVVRIGEKDVPMLAMASVDNYYMHIFGEDPVRIQEKADATAPVVELLKKMAFVMAKFAELKDRKAMFKLSEADYFDWLDQFERNDIYEAIGDIRAVYEGNRVSESEPKKKDED